MAIVVPTAAHAQSLYREIEEPKGKPVGAILVIHGGGWRQDPAGVVSERAQAKRFTREGWLVWNVDYRSGAAGFEDVVDWFRKLQKKTRGPVCAYGGSAGGNFALLLATREQVDCVIADAPATDLPALPELIVQQFVVPAFGNDQAEFSPLAVAEERPESLADTRILLGHFEGDVVSPIDQSTRFADSLPFDVPVFELPFGPAPFEHGAVDPAALEKYQRAQARLLSDLVESQKFAGIPFATERVSEIVAAVTQRSF
jgi:acetyl esterase/lipase